MDSANTNTNVGFLDLEPTLFQIHAAATVVADSVGEDWSTYQAARWAVAQFIHAVAQARSRIEAAAPVSEFWRTIAGYAEGLAGAAGLMQSYTADDAGRTTFYADRIVFVAERAAADAETMMALWRDEHEARQSARAA